MRTKMGLSEDIAAWIEGKVRSAGAAGAAGAVLGLSGGVDSAVVAGLCKKALGQKALGLVMSCESSPQDEKDAIEVARAFSLETLAISLDGAFRALVSVLPGGPRLARANLKPRLRMIALYYVANSRNYLVCGTGNKSEIQTGYFTKYGDGAADIMPLGGLLKTQVRELARELGVPERIVEKTPSAGLWEGQTDEGELGMSYAEIDRALSGLDSPEAAGVGEILERVEALVRRSEHKRKPPPVFKCAE